MSCSSAARCKNSCCFICFSFFPFACFVLCLNTLVLNKGLNSPKFLLGVFFADIEVLDFFDAENVDLRKYPIIFDSWSGSQKLIGILSDLGFESILIHGKSNYVMRIDKTTARLSEHKKSIKLCSDQWGCDKPICRVNGESPTFGAMVLLFFLDSGKGQTMMVFGKPLRACEILKV